MRNVKVTMTEKEFECFLDSNTKKFFSVEYEDGQKANVEVETPSETGDHDPVNHPTHYNKGQIEVADFIADQDLDFDRGNAVKYICRAGEKEDAELTLEEKAIQDLEKAVWYLNHRIGWIEKHGLSR